MAGTRHFGRLGYNVSRGLREIVAPRQTMPEAAWLQLKQRFNNCCVYCEEEATQANRGIVPDHVVPIEQFGELVLGNTVPACQTCNDIRGKLHWKEFLFAFYPDQAPERAARIEAYLVEHPYVPLIADQVLTPEELVEYSLVLAEWEVVLSKAQSLKAKADQRRATALKANKEAAKRQQA